MAKTTGDEPLVAVLESYQEDFRAKERAAIVTPATDPLMAVFALTPDIKNTDMQYFGRQLGMCWQTLVKAVLRSYGQGEYEEPKRYGADQPYDVKYERRAIDTKYRVGSGDAGTLKKFKDYGKLLTEEGAQPLALILRDDSLPAALTAMRTGGWEVLEGDTSFEWIASVTNGFRIDEWLVRNAGRFSVL